MRKLAKRYIAEYNPNTRKDVILEVSYNMANRYEVAKGSKPFILKVGDSPLKGFMTKEELMDAWLNNGEAQSYAMWHKLIPIKRNMLLPRYSYMDSEKVFSEALESVNMHKGSREYNTIMEMMRLSSRAMFKEMRLKMDEPGMSEAVEKFVRKYFVQPKY